MSFNQKNKYKIYFLLLAGLKAQTKKEKWMDRNMRRTKIACNNMSVENRHWLQKNCDCIRQKYTYTTRVVIVYGFRKKMRIRERNFKQRGTACARPAKCELWNQQLVLVLGTNMIEKRVFCETNNMF